MLVDLRDFGSIEQRDGGRWRVRVRIDGRLKTYGTYDTHEEAEAALAAYQATQREKASTKGLTLRSWGETWLNRRASDGAHRAVHKERSVWRMHVLDTHLSRTPLRKLERRHVVVWLDALTRKEAMRTTHSSKTRVTTRTPTGRRVSVSTCKKALALVRRCLSEAADLGHVRHNVALGVSVPKRVELVEAWDWLRAEELVAVLSLPLAPHRKRPAGSMSLKQRTAITVAAHTGVRAAVLWRLRWADVHLDGKRPELVARGTKSGKIRRVPLLPAAVEALKAWRVRRPAIGDALVFPAKDGRPHREGYEAGLDRLLRLAGVERRVRWHDLRHTCGAHLIQGTWTVRPLTLWEVRDWLGHSSVTVTERYAHLAPDGLHDLARPRLVLVPEGEELDG